MTTGELLNLVFSFLVGLGVSCMTAFVLVLGITQIIPIPNEVAGLIGFCIGVTITPIVFYRLKAYLAKGNI